MSYIYINDLIDKYPNKTILEINDILLQQGISNKTIKIKVSCKVCGCELITTPGLYRKQKNFYCNKHMKHKSKGKDSKFYNRISTTCSYCNKQIFLTPYDYNKSNKFGDSNHFCSQECYWHFRSTYYRGEKGAMYNHKYTQEQKDNITRGVAKRLKSIKWTNTTIQLSVNQMLDDLNILYDREHTIDYYSCDNFLLEHNMIIEVMGDYWHGNPLQYNTNGRMLNAIQTKTILKDKQKRGYINNHYKYPILYLWECDIKNNPNMCKELILQFVKNGVLDNYNSFNYSYNNEILQLNQTIIIPYQDMTSKEYGFLIKQPS